MKFGNEVFFYFSNKLKYWIIYLKHLNIILYKFSYFNVLYDEPKFPFSILFLTVNFNSSFGWDSKLEENNTALQNILLAFTIPPTYQIERQRGKALSMFDYFWWNQRTNNPRLTSFISWFMCLLLNLHFYTYSVSPAAVHLNYVTELDCLALDMSLFGFGQKYILIWFHGSHYNNRWSCDEGGMTLPLFCGFILGFFEALTLNFSGNQTGFSRIYFGRRLNVVRI